MRCLPTIAVLVVAQHIAEGSASNIDRTALKYITLPNIHSLLIEATMCTYLSTLEQARSKLRDIFEATTMASFSHDENI